MIFLTFMVFMLGPVWWMDRREHERIPLARLADPAPLPGELPRAGRFDVEYLPGPPFAGAVDCGYELVDTGPLLLLSDKMAANAALEREIKAMAAEAERRIGPIR